MTDQPGTLPAAEAAADRLLAALHDYIAAGPVDLIGPVDDLLAAVQGSASEAAVTSVLSAVAAIPVRYWSALSPRTDGSVAERLAKSLFVPLQHALFAVTHPFDGQGALLDAEREVAGLEQDVRGAGEALERAVATGDIAAVLSLRADAEITIPGKLAAARGRLMQLELDAAEAKLEHAGQIRSRLGESVTKARAAAAAAAEELKRCAAAVQTAEAELSNAATVTESLRGEIARRSGDLEQHQTRHERQQQDRIRQLAGLAAA